MLLESFRRLALGCALASTVLLLGCGQSKASGDDGEAGDSGGGRGSGGSSGASGNPSTSNLYVAEIRSTAVDKVDLLLMIDSSLSMLEKHELLADAMPVLLERLLTPRCRDVNGNLVGSQPCPSGTTPEFRAVENLHIGVITSSLGNHGGDVCTAVSSDARTVDDRAELLPSMRSAPLQSWNAQGFLAWDPRTGPNLESPHAPPAWGAPGGPGDAASLAAALTDQLRLVGDQGCGFEASLEAWYRFLIDPEPVGSVGNDGTGSVRGETNALVLQQRASFLRPDSLLAIVMLTDENDCSILDEDGSRGWFVGFQGGATADSFQMPRASEACLADPNDLCCRSCADPPPAGCADDASDDQCSQGIRLNTGDDALNLRCYRQRERFGMDLLYPVERYVEGLTEPTIDPRGDGNRVPNPLFSGPGGARAPSAVVLMGIVGVPWQDIATDDSVPGRPDSLSDPAALAFLTADELLERQRWDMILGDPARGVPPTDPLMIESIDPRQTGTPHPLGIPGAAIAASNSTTLDNVINGHELAVSSTYRGDLQYACIYPIEPVPCDADNADGCDCNYEESEQNSPLCDYPTQGADGIQHHAKAYPSLRILEVLKGIGSQAVVASACAKNTLPTGSPATDPYYGYNPAVAALVDRIALELRAKCLPRPLVMDEDGRTPCRIIEARLSNAGACSCDSGTGRLQAAPSTLPAVREYLQKQGACGASGTPACEGYCFCEIEQFESTELSSCQTEAAPPAALSGFCYVDPMAAASAMRDQASIDGQSALVAGCRATERRVLRFLGDNVPAKDALVFIACSGATAL